MSLLINGLFAQSLRYAPKIILGISTICLWLDLERKFSLIKRLIHTDLKNDEYRSNIIEYGMMFRRYKEDVVCHSGF